MESNADITIVSPQYNCPPTFNEDDEKYKCCCCHWHLKNGTLAIGIVTFILVVSGTLICLGSLILLYRLESKVCIIITITRCELADKPFQLCVTVHF